MNEAVHIYWLRRFHRGVAHALGGLAGNCAMGFVSKASLHAVTEPSLRSKVTYGNTARRNPEDR